MATILTDETDLFHLCTTSLAPGSIINPGGRGRIIQAHGWTHGSALTEAALEQSRIATTPHLPSRMMALFAFVTVAEARMFVGRNTGDFGLHFLYRVRLVDPSKPCHITDWRLNVPRGTFRSDWADAYWWSWDTVTTPIPG